MARFMAPAMILLGFSTSRIQGYFLEYSPTISGERSVLIPSAMMSSIRSRG